MRDAKFQPGFRFSLTDAVFLALGTFGAIWIWPRAPWLGFTIAFVIGHFFLFCNVFRVSRDLELLWAFGYIVITLFTLRLYAAAWSPMSLLPLAMTALVIRGQLGKPSYHGTGWRRINPGLVEWWNTNRRS